MNTTCRKTLVLGLGNDILTDDAIGLKVVREVGRRLGSNAGVDVRETMEMGLALLDFIVGYEALVLVDSIQTGRAAPGHVHDMTQEHLKALPGRTPHFLGVKETLALGRQLGLAMPERFKILAIEVQDPYTVSAELSPALECAFDSIVDQVVRAASAEASARA